MADRLPRLLAALAALIGVGALLVGVSVFVEAWQASRAWADSAQQPLAALPADEAPAWLGPPAAPGRGGAAPPPHASEISPARPAEETSPLDPAAATAPTQSAGETAPPQPPSPSSTLGPSLRGANIGFADIPSGLPNSRGGGSELAGLPPLGAGAEGEVSGVSPADIELVEVEFRFLTPPEPGAHARLAVTLQNRADVASGPISLALAQRWLQAFSVFGAVPDVLDDRLVGDTDRRFDFPGLNPQERRTVELHLLATADEVDAPEIRVLLARLVSDVDGAESQEIGKIQPRTVAPRPRPGPARSVIVPKLGVRTSVVPVAWEPPPFVIGQLLGSSHVSEGNTVLIGHLAGPLGDIFSRLSQLRPGDEVAATSRGLEYRFVVSEISVRPYDDIGPTVPTATPRLTLMTCTGQWSVLRQDYSHRLWVVAEPPELAQETIRANAARAAEDARQAEAAAAARATHEAEVIAQAGDPQAAPMLTPPVVAGQQPPGESVGAAPVVVASPAAANPAELLAPGHSIESPVRDARVPQRLVVRGRRTEDADLSAPLWLLVRAELEGSRWYALPQPLTPEKDGRWQAELELGGVAGIRHEIRVGVVDADTDALLRRHASERPGQPLDELPAGVTTGARLTVERR